MQEARRATSPVWGEWRVSGRKETPCDRQFDMERLDNLDKIKTCKEEKRQLKTTGKIKSCTTKKRSDKKHSKM